MTLEQEESGNAFSEIVVDHATNPRNVGSIDDADAYASVLGSCGDNMRVWLKVRDDHIEKVTFLTDGCSGAIACGSMITQLAKSKTLGEALAISAEVIANNLGGLPDDHAHCAGLASLTLKKAIIEYLNLQKEPWKQAYRR